MCCLSVLYHNYHIAGKFWGAKFSWLNTKYCLTTNVLLPENYPLYGMFYAFYYKEGIQLAMT